MLARLTVVSALLLAGCSPLPINAVLPKFSVAEIDIKSLGLFEQQFDVGLRLYNPNEFDLRIEALEYELEVNGQPFAKGLTRSHTLLPALSGVVLRVDAVTQSKDLVRQFFTLPPDMLKEGVPYRIKGRVKTDKWLGWLPFEDQGVYGGVEKKPEGIAI
jgi:LEA14-like dessication related protein